MPRTKDYVNSKKWDEYDPLKDDEESEDDGLGDE